MIKFRRLIASLFFAIKCHKGQKRKYSGLPYWTHPLAVAYMVYKTTKDEISTVVAIFHDIFEDCECSELEMDRFLSQFYAPYEVEEIIKGVEHLTDEYIRISYPNLNRKKRKQLEAERLGQTPAWIQTIKYADLLHNTRSIVKYDKDFSVVYLKEKEELLNQMRKGDAGLYAKACISLLSAKEKLKK